MTPPELYEAAYSDIRNTKAALLVEDTTCRKVLSDDFTKYGESELGCLHIVKEEGQVYMQLYLSSILFL